jgi:hypoxanthine phosphoribosyltransferase
MYQVFIFTFACIKISHFSLETIKILDKEFVPYISEEQISETVNRLANEITRDLADKDPIFLGILNGSFLFAADLFRQLDFPAQITFLKLASYQGTTTTGKVKRLIGINEDIKDKTIVIIEDIVDTGITMDAIKKQLSGYEPKEIKIATLIFKPDSFQGNYPIDYKGFSIPNDFIVGYGLDYDGYGRNLSSIYKIKAD